MQGISKTARILTKIIEVCHWVAAGLMGAVGILTLAAPRYLKFVMDVESLESEGEISLYGFTALVTDGAGKINGTALFLYAIGAVAIFVLMALIFRNLYQVVKQSESSTPFSNENVNRLKKTGIFSIAVPLVGLVMSILMRLVTGPDYIEISVDLEGFVWGLLVLCLTQYFAHGARLENEVEGLL